MRCAYGVQCEVGAFPKKLIRDLAARERSKGSERREERAGHVFDPHIGTAPHAMVVTKLINHSARSGGDVAASANGRAGSRSERTLG